MTLRTRCACLLALASCLILPTTVWADDDDDQKVAAGPAQVTQIRDTSATVSGDISWRGSTTWWVEYGTTPAYGSLTPAEKIHGGPGRVSAPLTGLAASTTYHVRLVAAGGGRRSDGTGETFTTAARGAEPAPDRPAPPATPDARAEPGPPTADAPAAPALGKRVVAGVEAGEVRVRVPGTDTFQAVGAGASIPVGSVIDARRGTVALTAATTPGGATQTGEFRGGTFELRQDAGGKGLVDLHLRGGSLDACGSGRTLAAVAAKKPRPVRKLWGKDDHGRFRTHGRDSVATVRGTRWSVTDRCDGTLTKVTKGAVDVKVLGTGRVVRVRAGERHFARHVR